MSAITMTCSMKQLALPHTWGMYLTPAAACSATHLGYVLDSSSSLHAMLYGWSCAFEAFGVRLQLQANWLPYVLSQPVPAVTYLGCVPRRSQLLLQGSGDFSGIEEKIVRELQRHSHIALAEDERCCGWEVPEAAPSAVLSADAYLGVIKTSSNQEAEQRGLTY